MMRNDDTGSALAIAKTTSDGDRRTSVIPAATETAATKNHTNVLCARSERWARTSSERRDRAAWISSPIMADGGWMPIRLSTVGATSTSATKGGCFVDADDRPFVPRPHSGDAANTPRWA